MYARRVFAGRPSAWRLWRSLTCVSLQACELLVPGVRAEEWAVVDLVPICSQVSLWWAAARRGVVPAERAVDVLDGWAEHRVQTPEGLHTGAAALLDAMQAASPLGVSLAAGSVPEPEFDALAWQPQRDAIVTVLTAPGDPGTLTGPSSATTQAMRFGQAVVHKGRAWLPRAFGTADAAPYFIWQSVAVRPTRPNPLGEARSTFLHAVTAAESTLESLGLAPHGKASTGPMSQVRILCRRIPLPPAKDPRAVTLLEQATLILGAVSLATRTGSTAVHAHDARAFEAALRPLAEAARRALAAASSDTATGLNRVGP